MIFDSFGNDVGLTNSRCQQVRTNDVAAYKVVFLAWYAEYIIRVNQVATVIVILNTFHVSALTNSSDDQVSFNGVFLATFNSNRRVVFPFAIDKLHAGCAAFFIANDFDRHNFVHDVNAFNQCVFNFMLCCSHFFALEQCGQRYVIARFAL